MKDRKLAGIDDQGMGKNLYQIYTLSRQQHAKAYCKCLILLVHGVHDVMEL